MQKQILLAIVMLGSIACQKEKKCQSPQGPNAPALSAFVADSGSYFVYNIYEIDSNGQETLYGIPDTIFVVGDTVLNGKNFIHLRDQWFNIGEISLFFRDSSGYMVDNAGTVHWAAHSMTDTITFRPSNSLLIWHSLGFNNRSFQLPNGYINGNSVPAANRVAYELQNHHYFTNGMRLSRCDSGWIQQQLYVPSVGMVSSQLIWSGFHYSDCRYYERRLVYYSIKL